MNNTKEQNLPGEFDLKIIDCCDSTIRSNLGYYYAIGGNKNGNGVFKGKILKQENGWTLLKNLIISFKDIDMNNVMHDVVNIEDHIWIFDDDVFTKYKIGDNIEFTAKVYAYHRNPAKHNGKISINFSLKDIKNIKIIDEYDFPPKNIEHNQKKWHRIYIADLICDVCPYSSKYK
jgi:hypothetical protein